MKAHFFKDESPTKATFNLHSAGIEAEVFSDPSDSSHSFFLHWKGNVCLSKTWKDDDREEALAAAWAAVKDFCSSAMTMSEVISLLEEHCTEARP